MTFSNGLLNTPYFIHSTNIYQVTTIHQHCSIYMGYIGHSSEINVFMELTC